MRCLPRSLKIFLAFAFLSIFWGGSFVAIKAVTLELDSGFSAFLRLLVASIVLFSLLKWQKKKTTLPFNKNKWGLWLTGIVGLAAPFTLLFFAEKSITAGLAGLMNASVPIWLSLLILTLRPVNEKTELNPQCLWGVGLGFLGVFILFQPALGSFTDLYFWACLAAAGAALCYAVANLMTRHFMRLPEISLSQNLFEQHFGALVFLSFFALVTSQWEWSVLLSSWKILLAVIYLGAGSTALALLIYFYLLKEVGSIRASVVTYIMPIMALIFDYFFYRNLPSTQELIAAGIILASIAFMRSVTIPKKKVEEDPEPVSTKKAA